MSDKLPFLARLYTGVFPMVFGSNVLEVQHMWEDSKSRAICYKNGQAMRGLNHVVFTC